MGAQKRLMYNRIDGSEIERKKEVLSMKRICRFLMAASLLANLILPGGTSADEGMWLFNNPPADLLQTKYGFNPTKEWLEHVQRSSVRFNSGGSGSFVSADGLVMTNHHVGTDCIQKLGNQMKKDFMRTGFQANTHDEELKCVDEELNVLESIEDMTERVNAAVKPNMSPAEAQTARRAVINTIEKESLDKTQLRSDVITLYNGGAYHLYRYKKYTDLRMVFAPEKDAAFFGGDPDNFEYPRFDLDICFFRVYENGKPAKIEHYLRWSKEGCKDGELIFVSGHPGRTARLNTVQHLEFLRDQVFPFALNLIRRREVLLRTYSDRSSENARRAEAELFGYQNSRKAALGMLAGLQDPAIMNKKRADEKALREKVTADAKLKQSYGDAWERVAASVTAYKDIYFRYSLLEGERSAAGFNSDLFEKARMLVRLADESRKPNTERLREYGEAGLESLKQQLFSKAEIYADLEIVKLGDSLGLLIELLGADDDIVEKVLAGKSPQQRATELVLGSKLADADLCKKLADDGQTAIEESKDPMIELARLVDAPARTVRKTYEENVDEPKRQAYSRLAQARLAVYGKNVYPDATFTLRLAFGQVKGYTDAGQKIQWATTLGATYEHAQVHGNKSPFELPGSWIERKDRMKLDTPFNFVSTADIIGGNSGSPVINRNAELVGIIFDGNIHSLVLDFIYTDEQARAVSVHSVGIVEALRSVYNADVLVKELLGKH
jgi:hypothetical protein